MPRLLNPKSLKTKRMKAGKLLMLCVHFYLLQRELAKKQYEFVYFVRRVLCCSTRTEIP
jgi:hypothetical protein